MHFRGTGLRRSYFGGAERAVPVNPVVHRVAQMTAAVGASFVHRVALMANR